MTKTTVVVGTKARRQGGSLEGQAMLGSQAKQGGGPFFPQVEKGN